MKELCKLARWRRRAGSFSIDVVKAAIGEDGYDIRGVRLGGEWSG